MISGFFSINFPLITCIIMFSAASKAEDARYTSCSIPYSCGHLQNVGYPFWGGNRPKYCGIKEFLLDCKTSGLNTPGMIVYQNAEANLSLRVLGINTSSHTMDFFINLQLNRCYLTMPNLNNVTILPMLKPEAGYRFISLLYGCGTNCYPGYYSKTFSCSHADGNNSTAYYFDNTSGISKIGNLSCSCKYNFTYLVDKRAVDGLSHSINASVFGVLNKWRTVRMEYMVNFTACSKCQKSGGSCGSDPSSDHFVCYCRDGPQPLECIEPTTSKSGLRRKFLFVSGAAASLIGTMMLASLVTRANKRRKTNKVSFLCSRRTIGDQNVAAFLQSYGSLAPKRYTYADIRKITNSFKDKLGEGGYGSVYKGRLNNDRFVAVKKLKVLKGDGKDFINEVLSISRTNHVNVVTLLGFCYEGNKRALVFEFLPNGSLEKFIFGKEIRQSLQWETMFNIAIGIARGLDYLHRGCITRILHFDIKPHNILLDEEFRPKISDFGLARLCLPKNSMILMSEARGTIGYIAPEIFCRNLGSISNKSDVYSYGMMLIDLVCGRENPTNEALNNSEQYFPEWIYNQLEPMERAKFDGVMDDGKHDLERKMILVSLWCIQPYPSNRPPMNKVVEMLEGPFDSLQMPPKPHSSPPVGSVFDASFMTTA